MSVACLQLTEATLAYPGVDGEYGREDITLWGPETHVVTDRASGVGAFMSDPECYSIVCKLMCESGMHWGNGPFRDAVIAQIAEMEDMEMIDTAYESWCQEEANMDDLHEPSLFTEWNQATGCSNFVGADQMGKNMKVSKFTPEMLQQQDTLNYFYNFVWNSVNKNTFAPIATNVDNSVVPDTNELLTLTAVGTNHGVAKCAFGAVFIPKGAINHLQHNGGAQVGTIFDGEITFTPGNKFPWRLQRDGIKFTYEGMCGTHQDDY